MSLVLAFDTSTEYVALALGRFEPDGVRVVGTRDFPAPRAALSRLLPAVRELLHETGTEAVSVSTVVVGRGPGSFTGVRIGVATAKGLAHGLGARLLGVSTLDAVAWRFADRDRTVGVVGDAMRGEVYPAVFSCGAGRCERLTEDGVAPPSEVAKAWREALHAGRWGADSGFTAESAGGSLLLAGNGLAKYAETFVDVLGEDVEIAEEESWTPSGKTILLAAYEQRARQSGDPASVLPVYTRLSDAEEAERARAGAVASESVPDSGVAGPEERP